VITAGELKHRVSIQSESTAVDSYGEPTGSWSTDSTVWASVKPTRAGEQETGDGQTGVVTMSVIMRYTADATMKKRLLFGARVLGILSVINVDERNEHLQLICQEESN